MNEINCKFCGISFISDHGKLYCSEDCRYKAKQQQWKESGIKRQQGRQGQFPRKICPICKGSFYGNHNKKYCCTSCALKAKKVREKKYFSQYYQENKTELIAKTMIRKQKSTAPILKDRSLCESSSSYSLR